MAERAEATSCAVLGGFYAVGLQLLLFGGVCAVMLYKKHTESPPRSWPRFCADTSKQALGAAWIHVLNVGCAWRLQHLLQTSDECAWYWINIVLDCTLACCWNGRC